MRQEESKTRKKKSVRAEVTSFYPFRYLYDFSNWKTVRGAQQEESLEHIRIKDLIISNFFEKL